MTQEEYKQLEDLLGKLQDEFKKPYIIQIRPGFLIDGYHIGVYDAGFCRSGKLIKEGGGANIESVVKKLTSTTP